ncbi:MAG: GNAT family N-acetyltransferase [Polyangiaceae bacterium]|jgi:ribosomal-protein-serine acetyltransferase|nr:GNAT family N-acetyltransferase [Polyangiaceae bacterium]
MLTIPARSEIRTRPVVGKRVFLSPLEGADARDMWAAVDGSRAHLYPWLPWVPFVVDYDSTYRFADASAADWEQGRACRFAIRDNTSRSFLGVVSLESVQHPHRSCELGYWLRKEVARAGYMTEASSLLIEWVFARLGAHRIRVAAATGNHASLAVIRRLGFHFEGIARQAEFCAGRWLDHAIWSLLSTDRQADQPIPSR